MADMPNDIFEVFLWRARLLNYLDQSLKKKEMKCCDVFNKHKKKAIGIHTIKLELVRYLKEKGISVIPGQKLCRNCYQTVKKEEAKVEDDMTNT